MNYRKRLRECAAAVSLTLLSASAVSADDSTQQAWTGLIGISLSNLSASGSEESFRTQSDLSDGVSLENLQLDYRPWSDSSRGLSLRAWGFGDAEPSEHIGVTWSGADALSVKLDYDQRRSIFALRESELALRADDWDLTSWRGRVMWDGWSAARLSLGVRRTTRDGEIHRPFYGLNAIYPLRVDLDDAASEVWVRVDSRTLPVNLTFEQSWTKYERRDRYSPDGEGALDGDDPDLLGDIFTDRDDEQNVATSRLTASYGNDRVELLANALYSPADLDSRGATTTSFDVGGGTLGTVQMIDDVVGSAERDTSSGNLRLGFRLAPSWTIRLLGDYRDSTTDASLLGERLIRVSNPNGSPIDFGSEIDESTLFDLTEDRAQVEVEWSRAGLSLWAGGFTTGRDVRWKVDDDLTAVERTSDGSLVGIAWKASRFSVAAEYTRGTFENYIFRNEPETVDRYTLNLRAPLGQGWELHARGRFESADNPASQASLDHGSEAYTFGAVWGSPGGGASFGVDLDRTDLRTETGVVLPGQASLTSIYDLSVLTASAYGRMMIRQATLSASAARVDDSGETWPIESWTGRARISLPASKNVEVSLFGDYWSYDEYRAGGDDFDVIRYGVALLWRFE